MSSLKMTEITTNSTEKSDFGNQKIEKMKAGHTKSCHFMISQHEALRRATLLKHRKVSTQLKLDMVQRQLSELKSSSSTDRQFYRSQLSQLSDELQDLGSSLEKVERNAFYARRRLFRSHGGHGSLQLSSSHPAIYSSSEAMHHQGTTKNGLKNGLHPSSPTSRFKKKHVLGELRAVASLSSLNIKSTPHSSCDDLAAKDSKVWKAPLRFLGHIVDSKICRKLWGSSKRVKSHENISVEHLTTGSSNGKTFNGLGKRDDGYLSSSTSSSESDDDSDEENKDWDDATKVPRRHAWKGPVERKLSGNQRHHQVDPAVMAEIEDFEKMAASYIKLHS